MIFYLNVLICEKSRRYISGIIHAVNKDIVKS